MAVSSLSADEFACQLVANEFIHAADIDVAGMICRLTKLGIVRLPRACRASSTHRRRAASSDRNNAPIRIGPFGLAPAERRQLISADGNINPLVERRPAGIQLISRAAAWRPPSATMRA
jgi:hypothetical protein